MSNDQSQSSMPVANSNTLPPGLISGGLVPELEELLRAVGAFTDLIKLERDEPRSVLAHTDNLAQTVRRALALLSQNHSLGQRLQNRRQVIQLQSIVTASLDLLQRITPDTIKFDLQLAPTTPGVLADPSQMHQLVLQLGIRSINALSLSPEKSGTLRIELTSCDISDDTEGPKASLRPGQYARLDFIDTGAPIDTAFLQHALAALPTPTQHHDPVGAALALAQQIITQHNGTLEVQSQAENGTSTTVYLPTHANVRKGDIPSGLPLGKGERVMFVDDDPTQCRLMEELLRRLAYTPLTYSDPSAALEYTQEHPDEVDLAIVDLNMPQMTGVDLATSLLELRPKLPVYLITGLQGDWTPGMARNLGIRGVLMKPMAPTALSLTLQQALHPSGE